MHVSTILALFFELFVSYHGHKNKQINININNDIIILILLWYKNDYILVLRSDKEKTLLRNETEDLKSQLEIITKTKVKCYMNLGDYIERYMNLEDYIERYINGEITKRKII